MTLDEYLAWLRERIARAETVGLAETDDAGELAYAGDPPRLGRPGRPLLGVDWQVFTLRELRILLVRAEARAGAREVATEATT